MKNNRKSRCVFICLLLMLYAFSFLLPVSSLSEASYVAPRLPSDAEPYDENHPENLEENQLYAKSAILVEAGSGKVIFEKDADSVMYPASTTKILTVLLGLTMGDLDETCYLTESNMEGIAEGDAVMGLELGESINFKDLLYGTFVRSANEGANLIAETVSGSIPAFVSMMNAAAESYGCTSTHFVNPNGLHDPDHYTTARDMATIARVAMQNAQFRDIAKCYTYSLPKSNLHRSRVLTHSSRLLFNPSLEDNEFYYPLATGIKSGFHNAAGYCFVGSAERDGIELISVVFYTTQNGRWTDTIKLFNYGFSQYISMTPAELYAKNPIVVETGGFARDDEGYGRLQLNARTREGSRPVYIVATRAEMETMARNLRQTVRIEYTRDFSAPIQQGEVMGTMTYYPTDGGSAVTYDLVAARSVEKRDDAPLSLEEIERMVYADPNPFPPITAELVIMLLIPLAVIFLLIRWLMRLLKHEHKGHGGPRIPKPHNRFYR